MIRFTVGIVLYDELLVSHDCVYQYLSCCKVSLVVDDKILHFLYEYSNVVYIGNWIHHVVLFICVIAGASFRADIVLVIILFTYLEAKASFVTVKKTRGRLMISSSLSGSDGFMICFRKTFLVLLPRTFSALDFKMNHLY